ncbi:MAG: N-acetyl-gamma-glutamyl-phosphate reductase [Bacteroides sp.]|nr:N-acetyl-gamma-glutamyl-phosphate reductase [Bacteroides sp.]MDE6223819.1 N-acetyl-gamma-glutamyl-phosphate reductase [Muribaculaceae bacterium]MDE6818945.1 N-acetyl-gamma-glutamyl-phosphate reductase [Muribaculaceae bacterium]
MIRAGILGGEGFAAGELIRLLINHPDVELARVQSKLYADRLITEVHQGMEGETYLRFTPEVDFDGLDVVFCCYPHGNTSRLLADRELPEGLKVIDLARDFRIESPDHEFVYGLPELNRRRLVHGATRVANPGAFATAIELALLPLAKNLLLNAPVHITAITGFSGSAVEKSSPDQLAWHRDNVSIYQPLHHDHLPEIRQVLQTLQSSFSSEIMFIPMRGSFARGMLITAYMDMPVSIDQLRSLYEDYYADHSFTFVVDRRPDLKDVVNTNKCLIHLEKVGDRLLVTAVIDNIIKGAAGQAVHNMNLLFGLHEKVGLALKSSTI